MIHRIIFVGSSNTSESHFTKFERTVVSVTDLLDTPSPVILGSQAAGNVGRSNSWNTRLPSPPKLISSLFLAVAFFCLFIIHRSVLCPHRCN